MTKLNRIKAKTVLHENSLTHLNTVKYGKEKYNNKKLTPQYKASRAEAI